MDLKGDCDADFLDDLLKDDEPGDEGEGITLQAASPKPSDGSLDPTLQDRDYEEIETEVTEEKAGTKTPELNFTRQALGWRVLDQTTADFLNVRIQDILTTVDGMATSMIHFSYLLNTLRDEGRVSIVLLRPKDTQLTSVKIKQEPNTSATSQQDSSSKVTNADPKKSDRKEAIKGGNKSSDDASKTDDKPSSKFELRTLRQSARNSPRALSSPSSTQVVKDKTESNLECDKTKPTSFGAKMEDDFGANLQPLSLADRIKRSRRRDSGSPSPARNSSRDSSTSKRTLKRKWSTDFLSEIPLNMRSQYPKLSKHCCVDVRFYDPKKGNSATFSDPPAKSRTKRSEVIPDTTPKRLPEVKESPMSKISRSSSEVTTPVESTKGGQKSDTEEEEGSLIGRKDRYERRITLQRKARISSDTSSGHSDGDDDYFSSKKISPPKSKPGTPFTAVKSFPPYSSNTSGSGSHPLMKKVMSNTSKKVANKWMPQNKGAAIQCRKCFGEFKSRLELQYHDLRCQALLGKSGLMSGGSSTEATPPALSTKKLSDVGSKVHEKPLKLGSADLPVPPSDPEKRKTFEKVKAFKSLMLAHNNLRKKHEEEVEKNLRYVALIKKYREKEAHKKAEEESELAKAELALVTKERDSLAKALERINKELKETKEKVKSDNICEETRHDSILLPRKSVTTLMEKYNTLKNSIAAHFEPTSDEGRELFKKLNLGGETKKESGSKTVKSLEDASTDDTKKKNSGPCFDISGARRESEEKEEGKEKEEGEGSKESEGEERDFLKCKETLEKFEDSKGSEEKEPPSLILPSDNTTPAPPQKIEIKVLGLDSLNAEESIRQDLIENNSRLIDLLKRKQNEIFNLQSEIGKLKPNYDKIRESVLQEAKSAAEAQVKVKVETTIRKLALENRRLSDTNKNCERTIVKQVEMLNVLNGRIAQERKKNHTHGISSGPNAVINQQFQRLKEVITEIDAACVDTFHGDSQTMNVLLSNKDKFYDKTSLERIKVQHESLKMLQQKRILADFVVEEVRNLIKWKNELLNFTLKEIEARHLVIVNMEKPPNVNRSAEHPQSSAQNIQTNNIITAQQGQVARGGLLEQMLKNRPVNQGRLPQLLSQASTTPNIQSGASVVIQPPAHIIQSAPSSAVLQPATPANPPAAPVLQLAPAPVMQSAAQQPVLGPRQTNQPLVAISQLLERRTQLLPREQSIQLPTLTRVKSTANQLPNVAPIGIVGMRSTATTPGTVTQAANTRGSSGSTQLSVTTRGTPSVVDIADEEDLSLNLKAEPDEIQEVESGDSHLQAITEDPLFIGCMDDTDNINAEDLDADDIAVPEIDLDSIDYDDIAVPDDEDLAALEEGDQHDQQHSGEIDVKDTDLTAEDNTDSTPTKAHDNAEDIANTTGEGASTNPQKAHENIPTEDGSTSKSASVVNREDEGIIDADQNHYDENDFEDD